MSSVYSERWHRVAGLKPRLAPQVSVRRQRVRGQTWMLLADAASGRACRLSRAAYEMAARFDGRRAVQALWEATQQGHAEPPTQDEVIELLARLREQQLVEFDRVPDLAAAPRADEAPSRVPNSLLAWRLPLGRPQRLLQALAPWTGWLFSRPALAAMALLLAWLAFTVVEQAGALWQYGARWAGSPRLALWALLLYPPIKALHELAHGLVARRHGATVHEAGLTLMLGLPLPYVDISSSASLARRSSRLAIAAAGIGAELVIGDVALALWLVLPDGLAREAAFAAFGIAGLSTLLFNANPLQRLDGYHLATDLLGLPNLAPRSRAWWLDLARRRLLRLPQAEPMVLAAGERPWLAAYAPLSWAWGTAMGLLAAAWVGSFSAVLGLVTAALVVAGLGLAPAWRLQRELRRMALHDRAAARRAGGALALAAVALLLGVALPLPQRSVALGVLWPPDDAQLRAASDGFVAEVHHADGDTVQAGELVLTLANPALQARQVALAGKVETLQAQVIEAAGDGERQANLRAELQAARAELARHEQRLAGLELRAPAAGRIALPDAADLPVQWIREGRLLGQVLTGEAPTVRVAVPEDQARRLAEADPEVSLMPAGHAGAALAGRVRRDSVGAVARLPSAALSLEAGGAIATDPADTDHLKALQPVVMLDVQIDLPPGDAPPGLRIGSRVAVRFDEGWSPLAWQWAGEGVRRLAARLNPWQ